MLQEEIYEYEDKQVMPKEVKPTNPATVKHNYNKVEPILVTSKLVHATYVVMHSPFGADTDGMLDK